MSRLSSSSWWLAWRFTQLWCAYTLVAYGLGYSLWLAHWAVGFVLLTVPGVLIGCVGWVVFWAVRRSRRVGLPLAVLVLGWPFWQRTVALDTPAEAPEGIEVLSYNAMFFDVDAYSTGRSANTNAKRMIKWVREHPADLKVFQEFYNWEGQERFRAFNTTEQLSEQLRYRVFMRPPTSSRTGKGFVGLAMFAKYPLVYRSERSFSDVGNGYLVADMIKDKDTIRVINVHLHSMGIRVGKILRQRDYEKAKTETRNVLVLLKNGFERRAKEISEVERVIGASPYPVLLCGDLNEVPYGYVYGRLRKHLTNSFEEAGSGFGFTYNRQPKFIRIDNQFYGPGLRALALRVEAVRFSDHYPLVGIYQIE